MNIQIYGKSKCFDTKKAERWFKERRIKFQSVDILRFGLSPREYESVRAAAGGMRALIDEGSRAYEELFIAHLAREADVEEKLLENPELFKTPIVRNGRKATVGYRPDVWEQWAKEG
ncbi:MAG: ArsC family transcriptional regulator [Oscillospiraceae bacterium]|nr:ArsC family transcriptional regulator [Oscillospiraceae bacterium]